MDEVQPQYRRDPSGREALRQMDPLMRYQIFPPQLSPLHHRKGNRLGEGSRS
jgi:hypothetical protein